MRIIAIAFSESDKRELDKIYRTRENRAYCQERGIRISGPPLGRPKINISIEEKKQAREDEGIRNTIEGKFGQLKRRFSLDRVMTKLPNTSQTSIAITFLVINLDRLLRQVLGLFLVNLHSRTIFLLFWQIRINKNYTSPSYKNKNLSC